jgi:peptidoglycan/LPS O-acetylase OafA/YrhL
MTSRTPTTGRATTWRELPAREKLRVIVVIALIAALVALPWVGGDHTRAVLYRVSGPVIMAAWSLWFGVQAARAFRRGQRRLALLSLVGMTLSLLMLLVFIQGG